MGDEVFIFHSDLSFKEKKALADGFEERTIENDAYLKEYKPRILTGTTGVLGTGLNLVQMLIMEPSN